MSGFAVIIEWLRSFWQWVQTAFTWLIDGILYGFEFVAFTLLDGVLSIIEALIAAIDLSAVAFNYAAAWSSLPSQLVWFITALGLPQCFTMLGAAYIIRLTLNLIPSWATRV